MNTRYLLASALYLLYCCAFCFVLVFFFQAEDGIRDLVRSRGLGDVYKRQEVQRPGSRRDERAPVLRHGARTGAAGRSADARV